MSKNAKSEAAPSRAKAVRLHCIQCSGGNRAIVRRCVIKDCNLYPFRMGSLARGKEADAENERADAEGIIRAKAG